MGQQGMLTEAEEMELASELLSVTNEAELEQFLGSFLKKAASFAGNVVRSPIGKAIAVTTSTTSSNAAITSSMFGSSNEPTPSLSLRRRRVPSPR